MAAISTSSPMALMNPTTTEHDWRFPRRPNNEYADSGADAIMSSISQPTAATDSKNDTRNSFGSDTKRSAAKGDSMKQLRFDLSDTIGDAQRRLSKAESISGFRDGLAGMSASPEELAKDDPLATQIWRFFAKTKQSLPNQERMENLTWRMMHVNLRKQGQKDHETNRYAVILFVKRRGVYQALATSRPPTYTPLLF